MARKTPKPEIANVPIKVGPRSTVHHRVRRWPDGRYETYERQQAYVENIVGFIESHVECDLEIEESYGTYYTMVSGWRPATEAEIAGFEPAKQQLERREQEKSEREIAYAKRVLRAAGIEISEE